MSLEENINEYLSQYEVVKEIKEKLDSQRQEVERLNNIINKIFSFCKTQQENCFDVVAEQCYSEIMYLIEDELEGSEKE